MNLIYKFIHFEKAALSVARHTEIWNCINTKSGFLLGQISYYPNWRKYIFSPGPGPSIFDSECLLDIADFIKNMNEGKKK